jgi:hypothetical protein
MKRVTNLDDALFALGEHGFLVYQHQDENNGDMWIDVCQVMRTIHNQPVPHHLTPLPVYSKPDDELVVNRDDLRAILKQPSELPGDYIPEARYEIPMPPVDVREEFAALDKGDDGALEGEGVDEEDEDDVDYAEQFSKMGAE